MQTSYTFNIRNIS